MTKLMTANTDKEKKKANQQYEKVYSKHQDKAPLGERMRGAKEENKRTGRSSKPKVRSYSMHIMFYNIKTSKDTIKTSFKDSRGRSYISFWFVPQTVSVITTSYVENLIRKRIFKFDKEDRFLFRKLMKTVLTDRDVEETLNFVDDYIDCMQVLDVDRVDGSSNFSPHRENLPNTANVSMYHRYIQTPLNPDFETFKEAIKVNHYTENECWLNTITDFYKSSLTKGGRRTNSLGRRSLNS